MKKAEKFKQPNPVPDHRRKCTLNRADGRRVRRYVSQQEGKFKTVKPFHLLVKGA